jgi:hypothetical protein
MRDVFDLERTTEILRDDPYVAAYPHLVDFFATKPAFEPGDVVCGAHMVYGWMPTVLELYPDPNGTDLIASAALLERARKDGKLGEGEVAHLVALVNNSLVGVSKLLHFVAPTSFAIWDSRVYSFVHEERPHNYRVNNVAKYFDYLERLRSLKDSLAFNPFHKSVKTKLGYEVSPLRALELIMFLNAPVYMG